MLPNYDKRPGVGYNTTSRDAAVAQLRQQVENVHVDFDDKIGSPKWIYSLDGFLRGPVDNAPVNTPATLAAPVVDDPNRVARAFLNDHTNLFGFGAEALDSATIKNEYITPHNRVRTVVWEQQLDGIPVFEALFTAHTTEKDDLVSISSQFLPELAHAADTGTPQRAALEANPTVSAANAVALAAHDVGETLNAGDVAPVEPALATDTSKHQLFHAPVLTGDTQAKLVWLPMNGTTMRLCWQVILTSRTRGEMFLILLDTETGEPLVRHCLTDYISPATYRVYTSDSPAPLTPGPSAPSTIQAPLVPRDLVTLTALDTNASPNGWIDDGVNETRGNNVDAHTDLNADDIPDLPRPQGSPPRTFDFPIDFTQAPLSYANASVTELFYLNNWIHDKYYQLGFTEAARNFQNNNFGRGGLGNDAVQADAQDGSGTDNANFSTPPDGSPGRMQMYVFTGPTPDRDGDLDAEIVIHEYTHGLSNRRVGGGIGISALVTGGMGEGWSDFYALCLLAEAGDDVNGTYSTGGYVTYLLGGLTQNYYFGIRRYPYCTDTNKNPLTFKDIDPAQASTHPGIPKSPIIGNTANEVHNMGEVWCNTLWEMRVALVNKYGFATGNLLTLQLVTDGMNLGPANPNFLQSRDAILMADQVDNGGADLGEIWAAFAKRGMGFSATAPPSSTTAGLVEKFDVPFLPMTLVLPTPVSETTNFFLPNGFIYFKTPSPTNVVIKLTNSNPHEISVQPILIMPAGQTSAVLYVKVIDDYDLDGTQSATVTASAAGYATVSFTMFINDNETATLGISAPAAVTEGDGTVPATLTLSAPPSANILVSLTSSDTSEIQVPATVTLPAGQTSVPFNLTVVDDTLIDGDQPVTITAHVVNWTDGIANLIVHDNEDVNLRVALPPQAREGDGLLVNAGTVSISGTLPTNLLVSLVSDDTTELTVQPNVTILSGQTSAQFNITVVDDMIVDGSQLVHVIASAAGFVNGSTNITITDAESPFPPSNPRPGNLAVNVPANTNLMWDNGDSGKLILNGGFETGTFDGWIKANVPGTFGDWVINDGIYDPPGPEVPTPPFAGSFSAIAEQTGPGTNVIYQDVTISPSATSASLTWTDRLNNNGGQFAPNQFYRVEIRNTSDTILQVAYTTNPGDPLQTGWVTRNFNLGAYIGQTIRIAFVEGDNLGYFNVHLDNVNVAVTKATAGVTNDVYFGTNPVPGPAEYVGSTTSNFWLLPPLAPATTYYWQIIARNGIGGVTPGPIWQFTTKGVDHFVWDNISSPQLVNQPFGVRVTAKDEFNSTVTNFIGSAALVAAGSGQGQVFAVNFESGLQGFTINNTFGSGNGLWHLSTGRGANPGHSAVTSLYYGHNEGPAGGGNYDTPGLANGGVVTSAPINLPSLASGTNFLSFNYFMSVETATTWDQAYVEVSTNNGASYVIVSSKGTDMVGETFGLWVSNKVSLADFAGKTILLRFRFDTIDSVANTTEGWFMDDILISSSAALNVAPIAPTNTGPFTAGVWVGNVAVLQPATNITLRADDGAGHFGSSVPFDVGLSNDLSLAMTDSPDPVAQGGSLTYLLTVVNTGPATATDVVVSNFLPTSVALVSATASQGTVSVIGFLVRAALGDVPGGTNATLTLVVTPNSSGIITNRASVSRTGFDPFLGNNTAQAATTVTTPALSINDVSVVEGDSGTTNAVFTVTLSPPSPLNVSVNFLTANGSAAAGSDYFVTNGTLNFAPGETNKFIVVRVIGDTIYETNETFAVNLGAVVNAVIADNQGIGTILNDDPIPTISISDASLVEGDSGTNNMLFNVTLSGPSSFSTTVNYATADGTAVAGSDYIAKSGTLTIAPGSTNNLIQIQIKGDVTIESNETFFVQLSSAVNAVIGIGTGTGTIINDDGLPGKVDHFTWAPISSPQGAGQVFGVAITARDAFEALVTNFVGTVNLATLSGGGSTSNTILGNVVPNNSSSGDWTLGYSFTPNTNITVTSVRSYFGTKVSIWTDTGTLLVSQPVAGAPGTWTETPLASPVTLTAGAHYRVAAYTGGGNYYWRTDGPGTFPNGTIDISYETSGDGFPVNSDTARWWSVDLRYVIGASVTLPMSPTVSGPFTNGAWSGNLLIIAQSTNAMVRAVDNVGHTGFSNPFMIIPQNDIALTMGASPNPVGIASNLTYTLTVGNSGPTAATSVVVSNFLPATVNFVSATSSQGSCTQSGTLVRCDLGIVPGKSNATINIVVRPASAVTISNFATVTRAEADASLANNQASVLTQVRSPLGNGGSVAIFGSPSVASWNDDVRSKILGTGLFTTVDAFFVGPGNPVPTLSQLQQYAAVLVYSDGPFNDSVGLGNVLADYVDTGGGVVMCTFAFWVDNGLGIDGRLSTGSYLPFTQGSQDEPGGLTLVPDDPSHPILSGVSSFNGGTSSYHNSPINIANGAELVGHWSNGQPLVGALQPSAGRVVGLNFYPPSSDARGDFWVAATDGAKLMANALLWASPAQTAPISDDISLVVKDTPDPVAIGANLTYTISVSNSGPSAATSVVLSNALPASANLVSISTSQGSGTNFGGTVVCSLGTINGGTNATVVIIATPIVGGTISNRTSVVRGEPDAYLDNNVVSTFTTAVVPAITINDVSLFEGDTGTTQAVFTVSLSPPSALLSSVQYSTIDGTALATSDYASTNGTLVFGPGQTNKIIKVTVFGDKVFEDDEYFVVNLFNGVNVNITDSQGIGTILNDDPMPVVSIGNASVVEGNVGTTNIVFPITISGTSDFTGYVDYFTSDNTATGGSDYFPASGTLYISPGMTSTNITVLVNGDITVEPDETFFVTLNNPNLVTIGTDQGTGTILNDDGFPGQVDHFVWSPIASPQFTASPFGVTINARDAFDQPATNFNGVVNLSASKGSGGGGGPVKVLSFTLYSDNSPDGEYHHTLQVISNYFPNYIETTTITTDPATLQTLLADKQVFLIPEQENAPGGALDALGTAWASVLQNFVNGGGTVIACSWATQEHLILNNSGLLNLALLTSESAEPLAKGVDHFLNQGVATSFTGSYIGGYSTANGIVVMQGTDTGYPVVVARDVGPGHVAMIGTDFFTIGTDMDKIVANAIKWAQAAVPAAIPVSPTVSGNFVNGVWSGSISVLGAGTNVVLTANDGNGHVGSSGSIAVVLQNDLSVSVTDSPDPIAIGGNLTYSIVVTNSGPAASTSVVVSNTLPAGVTFVSATSSQGVVLHFGSLLIGNLGTINGGATATMNVVISPFNGGTLTNRTTVSRAEADPDTNNNSAITLTTVTAPTLSINDVSLLEGNSGTTNAVFTVVLSPAGLLPVSVSFATADNTATAGSDYFSTNGVLLFAPGETNKTITVIVKGDTSGEPDETFFVNLSSPSNAVISTPFGTGTILNDDLAAAVYLRSILGPPWGVANNEVAMDRVFGSGNWQDLRYETVNPGVLLSPSTKFIFMEGGDFTATEMETFLNTNLVAIQNWVSNGGSLFLNAAPNEDDGMNFGFGVTLNYPSFDNSAVAVVPGHPIFNGPFTPVGTNWTGTAFAHASVSGSGLVSLIKNADTVSIVLGEKAFGAGHVLFGGMTTDNFHSPQPQGSNLRANILAYLGGLSGTFSSFIAPPLVSSLTVVDQRATIVLNTLPNHRYRVSYADDLTGAPWIQLGDDVVASGYTMTVVDPNASASQRFYRVQEVSSSGGE